jgi:NAD(P)-dependent dehydrogenase (short-subunit alcohol dehydrogenase family)
VTGASRGIGRGIALALAAAHHPLALSARTEDGLAETAAVAASVGAGAVVTLKADLSGRESAAELVCRAADCLEQPPLVVVHCAGVTENGAIESLTLDEWQRAFQVNVTSAFQIAGAAVPAMKQAEWGRFIAVGSLYSRMGVAHTAAYTSSKHALLGLVRVLSAELISKGITANAILPGFVDTEMVR